LQILIGNILSKYKNVKCFDVIIIGAGPAGLKCAETLGNSNFKVLLLEKDSEIGPKPCGGLMTSKGLNFLNEDVGEEKFDYLFLNFASKKNKVDIHKFPLYTINRKNLGKIQLKKVLSFKNITVRKNSFVTKIENNYITVNNERIGFKYLVGADGSSSMVRKYLGLDTKKLGIAFHYVIPTNKYKNIEIFLDSKPFGPWYAWILPHKEYVSIGTGCDPKIISTKKIMDNFKIWLEEKNIDVSGAKYEAHTLNYDYRGVEFDNIFLTGDAAGLIYSFTGEGIHPAMVSGEEVAKKILNSDYNIVLDEILQRKRKQDRIAGVLMKSGFSRTFLHWLTVQIIKNKRFSNLVVELLA